MDKKQKIDELQTLLRKGSGFQADNVASIKKLPIKRYSAIDDRFELINIFNLVVPVGYEHTTRLDTFFEKNGSRFYFFNDNITDEKFAMATTKLVPGLRFEVKVFQISKRVSSDDCLSFLRGQKAVFAGAQGASLVWERKRKKLSPIGKRYISFDEKDALWMGPDSSHWLPIVDQHSDGGWSFNIRCFEFDWSDDSDYCLLCFCEDST